MEESPLLQKYIIKAHDLHVPPHHITAAYGQFLVETLRAAQAKSVLEIGTMWGYSTWWLLQGLHHEGSIITLDKHLEHVRLAKDFFTELNSPHIELRHADALTELQLFDENQFDVIFLDADRREYPEFFKRGYDVLAPGGLLIADNFIQPFVPEIEEFVTLVEASGTYTAVALPNEFDMLRIWKRSSVAM